MIFADNFLFLAREVIYMEEAGMDARIQRNYLDRLFNFIFGREDHKDWTLSLYNAVNGSHYTDPEQSEFNTVEDMLYMDWILPRHRKECRLKKPGNWSSHQLFSFFHDDPPAGSAVIYEGLNTMSVFSL